MPGAEVMIAGGGHQFQHGRLASVDSKTFTIPFAHVQLRGVKGQLLKTRWAFVPSKYLVVFDAPAMLKVALTAAEQQLGAESKAFQRILRSLEERHGAE